MKLNKTWTVFVINHSHVDVGYTDYPETIADFHADFLKQALEISCLPHLGESSYVYTCECFWQIEQFWKKASENEKISFIQAIKTGKIELTGMYLHMTDLPDLISLQHAISKADKFAKEYGLPLDSAMITDINGLPWCNVDILSNAGINYLLSNSNPHNGGYLFNKPQVPFYWESPQGKRLLVYSGLHYHKANEFGLVPGPQRIGDPEIPGMFSKDDVGFVNVQDLSHAENYLIQYLGTLESQQHPYNFILLAGSGLPTDNSPPCGANFLQHLERWNEKWGNKVHVKLTSLNGFMKHVEAQANIQVIRGDWNDWWVDGVASTPFETALMRDAQRLRNLSLRLGYEPQKLEEVTDDILHFAEHTWGHSSSVSDPGDFFVKKVQDRCMYFASSANRKAQAAYDAATQSFGKFEYKVSNPFKWRVLNPFPFSKKEAIRLPYLMWEQVLIGKYPKLLDEGGADYPFEIEPHMREEHLRLIVELQPEEEKLFTLVNTDKPLRKEFDPFVSSGPEGFENKWYQLKWNEIEGITNWVNKATNTELLGTSSNGLGQPIYLRYPDGDRNGPAALGEKRTIPTCEIFHGELSSLKAFKLGALGHKLSMEYAVEGTHSYRVEIELLHELPEICITITAHKSSVVIPEGLYISFPFALSDSSWYVDKPGLLIKPGVEQIENSCHDYYSIQRGAILQNQQDAIVFCSLDAPMVQLGGIHFWEYNSNLTPGNGLYSWPLNNKWRTNFALDLGGHYQFRYSIKATEAQKDLKEYDNLLEGMSYNLPVIRQRS